MEEPPLFTDDEVRAAFEVPPGFRKSLSGGSKSRAADRDRPLFNLFGEDDAPPKKQEQSPPAAADDEAAEELP